MRKLIFGCGYVGLRVARRWLAEGSRVEALTRRPENAARLQKEGIQPILGDVLAPQTLPPLDTYATVLYAIGYDRRTAASMRQVYVTGLRNVIEGCQSPPDRFLYISSTGVYGESSGQWIDERTPCRPQREGGRICLEAEHQLMDSPLAERSIIFRMAGIYGPGRIPRLQEILAAKPITAPREGTLNLIHVEDAVDVIVGAEERAALPGLYVVSDGCPVARDEYFRAMAELAQAPAPQFAAAAIDEAAAERARSVKRVDNSKMLRELRVALRYPNYRAGLAAILGSAADSQR